MLGRRGLGVLLCVALAQLGADRAGPARNAILFVGDGMGVPVVTATRLQGPGPRGRLALELPHTALVRTYSLDRMVTDSAAGAVALLSGQKVRSGVIGMSPPTLRGCSRVHREDESPNPSYPCPKGAGPIPSLADLALARGMAVGIVTTTALTHATPAAVYAHVDDRDMEDEIAAQLVERADLAFLAGGGLDHFRAFEMTPSGPIGRADGRDLVRELAERDYAVARSGPELRAAVAGGKPKVAALLAPGHLPFEAERPGRTPDLPALAELVELALTHLARQPGGYFLLVEGGRIDHALHANLAGLALGETLAFDAAVETARRLTSSEDTLLVVTADHGHPLLITGYPLLDDPVLGLARGSEGVETRDADGDGLPDYERALDGKGMTVLLFGNGPGHGDASAPERYATREDPARIPGLATDPRYMQESAVPLRGSTHEGSDVVAAAEGPGAERLHGFVDNTEIFTLIQQALGL